MSARRLAPLFAVAALAALALPATSASAQPEPIPGVWVLPANGASHLASSWPNATPDQMVDFTIYTEPGSKASDIEVATKPDLDPVDGTLLDANVIAEYVAPLRPPFDDVFEVRTDVADRWVATVGTYYWQAYYVDEADGEAYTTPVQRLVVKPRPLPDPSEYPTEQLPATRSTLPPTAKVVAPPPERVIAGPPGLTAISVRWALRRAIVHRTRHDPRRLRARCTRVTRYVAACRPTWRDDRHRYAATVQVTSRLRGPRAAFVSLDRTRLDRPSD
jgi:hypothetical protein